VTGYPRRFEGTLWLVGAALVLSGMALLPGAFELRWDRELAWRLPPGAGSDAATIHGVAASLFAVQLGTLWVVHMRSGWRRRRHRASGLGSALLLGALVATGWGLYYAGERVGAWASAVHIVVGLVVPLAVLIHVLVGKRGR